MMPASLERGQQVLLYEEDIWSLYILATAALFYLAHVRNDYSAYL